MKTIIKYTPRILSILLIFYFLMFSFDETIFSIGFLMHNIPTLIILVAAITAWKKPLIGGILFILIALAATIFFKTYQDIIVFFLISLPLLLIAGLFIADHYLSKPKK